MKKIATIEQIREITPHPNADKLVLAKVLGYTAIIPKDMYAAGDVIIFVQPDSVLPEDREWAVEYRKYAPKRIKAIKLRGIFSEGLILPFSVVVPNLKEDSDFDLMSNIGVDVSELLGIKHYEPPLPQDLSAKGLLPYGISKTDEERWENFEDNLPYGEVVDLTLKVDGQSCSFFYHLGEKQFGVLGRNFEYKLSGDNNYTKNAVNYGIEEKLRAYCEANNVSLCIRGESHGSGIQKGALNSHAKLPLSWIMFSVYLIDERRYARKGERFYFTNVAAELDLPSVPLVEADVILSKEIVANYSTGVEAIGGVPFEGVVVNHANGSFKIINKFYDANK